MSRKIPSKLCLNLSAVLDKLIEILSVNTKDFMEHHLDVFHAIMQVVGSVGARQSRKDHVTNRKLNI